MKGLASSTLADIYQLKIVCIIVGIYSFVIYHLSFGIDHLWYLMVGLIINSYAILLEHDPTGIPMMSFVLARFGR